MFKFLNFAFLAALAFAARPVFGQEMYCSYVQATSSTSTTVPSASCSDSSLVKYVKVNMHYILKSDGTGNFRPDDDGWGNTNYTGYDYAEELIGLANGQLANNQQAWLPSGNTIPIRDMKVQLVLMGTYFHYDTYVYENVGSYYAPPIPPDPTHVNWGNYTDFGIFANNFFAVNPTSELNIWMIIEPDYPNKWLMGIADINYNSIKIQNAWYEYHNGNLKHIQSRLILHELGHVWGLAHAWGDYWEDNGDNCSDTQPNSNCWMFNTPATTACDTWGEITNNLMDYSAYTPASITPCQHNKVHYKLGNVLNNYLLQCTGNTYCTPSNANFTIPKKICSSSPSFAVTMDGRASFNETNHFIEIFEVSTIGSTTPINNSYYSQWFSGKIGKQNLRTYCNYNFQLNKKYQIKLAVQNTNSNGNWCTTWDEQVLYLETYSTANCPTTGQQKSASRESEDFLNQLHIYPNPNNGQANIEYHITRSESIVSIALYNMQGQQVQSLLNGVPQESGKYSVLWQNNDLPSGTYLVVLRVNDQIYTQKLIVSPN